MRRKDLVENEEYIVTREMDNDDMSYCYNKFNVLTGKCKKLSIGKILICTYKGNNDGSMPYFILKDDNTIKVSLTTCANIAKNESHMSDRQKRIMIANNELKSLLNRQETLRGNLRSMTKDCSKLAEAISKKESDLAKLSLFESDEAELAYTISEILKSNGDKQEIIKILMEHNKTNSL